jgi:hypothetical protein
VVRTPLASSSFSLHHGELPIFLHITPQPSHIYVLALNLFC